MCITNGIHRVDLTIDSGHILKYHESICPLPPATMAHLTSYNESNPTIPQIANKPEACEKYWSYRLRSRSPKQERRLFWAVPP